MQARFEPRSSCERDPTLCDLCSHVRRHKPTSVTFHVISDTQLPSLPAARVVLLGVIRSVPQPPHVDPPLGVGRVSGTETGFLHAALVEVVDLQSMRVMRSRAKIGGWVIRGQGRDEAAGADKGEKGGWKGVANQVESA